jgi:preprotein translocase subunit SecA
MNKQREIIYSLRKDMLNGEGIDETILNMIDEKVEALVGKWVDPKAHPEDWDIQGLKDNAFRLFGIMPKIDPKDMGEDAFERLRMEDLPDLIRDQVRTTYQQKEDIFGKEDWQQIGRLLIIQIIDNQWVSHLQDMDHIKEGVSLRGYGQLDPLREYQKEGFILFEELLDRITDEILSTLFRLQLARPASEELPRKKKRLQMSHGDDGDRPATVRRTDNV